MAFVVRLAAVYRKVRFVDEDPGESRHGRRRRLSHTDVATRDSEARTLSHHRDSTDA